MKSILFLDIDGVLNSWAFLERLRRYEGSEASIWDNLDPFAVKRLNHIVERSGCEVVVSSTWRLLPEHDTPEKLQRVLDDFGFKGTVTGVTPRLGCEPHKQYGPCHNAHRGCEIKAYLDGLPEKVTRFAILDDDSDMMPVKDRHVKTTMEKGLLMEHVDKAVALLHIG